MPILRRVPASHGEPTVNLTVRLPPDLSSFIDEMTAEHGLSKNMVVTQMLTFARSHIEKGR